MTSRKGTYLAVMAVTAVLFVLYLFIAPSFLNGESVPWFVYAITLVSIAAVAAGLKIWRVRVNKKNPMDREEGLVSGEVRNVVKS